MQNLHMCVTKRDGRTEEICFDKISERLRKLSGDLHHVNIFLVAQKVIQSIYDGISTTQIDKRSVEVCAEMCVQHYEYKDLASRIAISNNHKNTLNTFSEKAHILFTRTLNGIPAPAISESFYRFVMENGDVLDEYIDYERDYDIDLFGFNTLERAYLLKKEDKIVERPQDLWMRVAVAIHIPSPEKKAVNTEVMHRIFETYDMLSRQYFTHATPTLFNAGTPCPSLASCYLVDMKDDLEDIFGTVHDCAMISKSGGGIGINATAIRGKGSYINGSGGKSGGIVPFLKVFEQTAICVDQGGRRPGSFSTYLEPHHPDIMAFLALSRKNAHEQLRANKLYLALWVSDLFMKRMMKNEVWSLFCPRRCPKLYQTYGEEFERLYEEYENQGLYETQVRARDIWHRVFESQKESGLPYILYKDSINKHSNQKNIGIIKTSNLCCEIVEHTAPDEYAVCNLASICLPKFVEDSYSEEEIANGTDRVLDHEFPTNPVFNYEKFKKVVETTVYNLNRVIDITHYPIPKTEHNKRHRPIGIGIQGLANVFFKFDIAFDSDEARQLNKCIFESLYYAALSYSTKQSRDLWEGYKKECRENGFVDIEYEIDIGDRAVPLTKRYTDEKDIPKTAGAYYTFAGSPLSRGEFHWESMGIRPEQMETKYDWETLRSHIQTFGTRNSLLLALMPTASTSQIMGNAECFEPITSNIFVRDTLSGEHIVVNKYLVRDLEKIDAWNAEVINHLKLNNGSVQDLPCLASNGRLRRKYQTVWELSQKVLIDLAAERQPFIDQSQSLNIYMRTFTYSSFSSMHLYVWKKNLKTGSYYLRTQEAVMGQKFTADENSGKTDGKNTDDNGGDAGSRRTVYITKPVADCILCSS